MVAYLAGQAKVEIQVDGKTIARTEIAGALRNTQRYPKLIVAPPQRVYDQKIVNLFRKFVIDFTDDGSVTKDAAELGRIGKEHLEAKLAELKALRAGAAVYPFIDQLDEPIGRLAELSSNQEAWFVEHFAGADDLLDAKDNVIDPIKAFLNGNQRSIYDDARSFMLTHSTNIAYLPAGVADGIETALEDAQIFRGNKTTKLGSAVAAVQEQLDGVVAVERDEAIAKIDNYWKQIPVSAAYAAAAEAARQSVTRQTEQIVASVQQEIQIPTIRHLATQFDDTIYPAILDELEAAKAVPDPETVVPDDDTSKAPPRIPTPPTKHSISIKKLSLPGAGGVLENEAQVDAYLGQLRVILLATINDNKRITCSAKRPPQGHEFKDAAWIQSRWRASRKLPGANYLSPSRHGHRRCSPPGPSRAASAPRQYAFLSPRSPTTVVNTSSTESPTPGSTVSSHYASWTLAATPTRDRLAGLGPGPRPTGDPGRRETRRPRHRGRHQYQRSRGDHRPAGRHPPQHRREGEAYALLLTAYCRHWHKTMPFMFEAEGAYTELLVPAGLLADGALLSRARGVLTEDVCGGDAEVIGWLYQFYISERKDEIFAGFKKNKKAGADEIPAATQLFTPHWIVRYLLENTLGRLWMLNRPSSRLVDQMDYYIAPIDEETDFLKVAGPEELTVIDPACGSGHMLTYAFDLLYAIYEEAGYAPLISRASSSPTISTAQRSTPAPGALAAFALTMKARGKDRRFFTRSGISPKICVIEPISFTPDDLGLLITKDGGDRDAEEAFWNQFHDADVLGSLIRPDPDATAQAAMVLEALKDQEATLYYDTLIRARLVVRQAEILSCEYLVVTANPPYMGAKNMDTRLADFAKSESKDSKSDLFSMFVERCLDLLPVGGYSGLMTPFVWMFISSYEALRNRVIREETITTLIQLEYSGGFDGATVPICAYVLRRGQSDQAGAFVRLFDFVGPAVQGPKTLEIIQADRLKRAGETSSGMERHLYRTATSDFAKVPGTPIAYWLSDSMRATFSDFPPALSSRSRSTIGMVTGKNALYVRQWWEVAANLTCLDAQSRDQAAQTSRRWFPLCQGW